jgi:methionyl-tRNA formyltransferase
MPESINLPEAQAELAALQPDLLVVCDYGEILAPQTLLIPCLGGINLHASLLPKYRGAAPVAWALLHGETETGVTVIQMVPHLDAGPCLAQQRVTIDPDETAEELEARLAPLGAELTCRTIDELASGRARPVPQDESQATRAPRLKKSHGQVAWQRTAVQIKNQVRAMQPWPKAYTHWFRQEGDPLRILFYQVAADMSPQPPDRAAMSGTITEADKRLVVAAGRGHVELLRLQPAGKRIMTAQEFLRGYPVRVGQRMGGQDKITH